MTRTIIELFTALSDTQELVSLILSFLDREGDQPSPGASPHSRPALKLWPQYATISKDWQYAVERETFSTISLKSSELQAFSRIFAPANRKAALTLVYYKIVLPTYDDLACSRFENTRDKMANDEAFSEAIHGLFALLKTWPENVPCAQRKTFKISISDVYSPYDRPYRDPDLLAKHTHEYDFGKRKDLWEYRYNRSIIKLKRWDELPTLFCVTEFGASVYSRRLVEPQSISRIASKFPSLRKINWSLSDNEKKDPNIRQQLRSDFALSLEIIPRTKLMFFQLEYYTESPDNQHSTPAKAQASATNKFDELSLALNKFCQSSPEMREIYLEGPISVSLDLFCPSTSPDTWLKLETFMVDFNINTPDGEWYFDRNPNPFNHEGSASEDDEDDEGLESSLEDDSDSSDYGRSEYDSFNRNVYERQIGNRPVSLFRTYPATDKIFPLLKAFATAITCMPVLKRACLEAVVPPSTEFEVLLLASGKADYWDHKIENLAAEEARRSPRLYFQTGSWRGEEDQDAFNEIVKIFKASRILQSSGQVLVHFFEF